MRKEIALLSEFSERRDAFLMENHVTYTGITILVVDILKYFQILHFLGYKSPMMSHHEPQQQIQVSRHIAGQEEGHPASCCIDMRLPRQQGEKVEGLPTAQEQPRLMVLHRVTLVSTLSGGVWAWALETESSEKCQFSDPYPAKSTGCTPSFLQLQQNMRPQLPDDYVILFPVEAHSYNCYIVFFS